MTNINLDDARRFYQWLDHRSDEYTELRIIPWPPTGDVKQYWVQNEKEFIKICKRWNGKRQIYAGVNPRFHERGSDEDIHRVTGIPFDIDSEHPKKEAATDAELAQAEKRMVELVSWMRIQGFNLPFVAMSGNGYHVIQKTDIQVDEKLESKLEAYFHEAPTEGMDSIFNLSRIIKIPGTLSVKGPHTEERPHRLSHIVNEGDPNADDILGEHINDLKPYIPTAATVQKTTTTKEVQTKRRTGSLRPCFKRFAEEGGKLSADGNEDNNLRLALVTEAHKKGYSRQQIIDLFNKDKDWNEKITTYNVDRQLRKISVKGLKGWSCLSIYKHGGCYYGTVCKHYSKRVKKRLGKKELPSPKNDESSLADNFFDEDGTFVPAALGDTLLENDRFAATGEKSKIWIYNPDKGVWENDGIEKIQEYTTHLLGDRFRNAFVTEVVKYIRYVRYIDPALFGSSKHTLVVKNGVLDLNTGELTPFDPDLYEINGIPVRFHTAAKSPKIEKFLSDVVPPGWAATIYEILGYTFLKSYPIARIFIFHGAGGNGKSQLIAIFKNFLGANNVSSCTLQQLVNNTFAPAQLHGKLANLCADIPPTPIKYTGIIKTLTGGEDQITAHYKYFALFGFVNFAKLIFSANEVPPADDNTPAWLRRPILIDFPNVFPAGDSGTILDLGNKISTDEELSGLLNLALAGLQRLQKKGRFTNEEDLSQRAEEYIRESNPALYFIINFVEEAPSMLEKLEKGVLYKNYVKVCHALGRRPLASNHFSAEIPRFLPYIDDGDYDKVVGKTKKGKPRTRKTRVWYGIKLKTEALTQALAELKTKYGYRYDRLDPRKLGESTFKDKKGSKVESRVERDGKDRSDNHEKSVEENHINQLLTDAIKILKDADGRMLQTALFQALIKLGYHSSQAREALRGDPRFVFMGMNVNLGATESEGKAQTQKEREENLRRARASISAYLDSHTWMTIRDIPEAIFSSLVREAGVKGVSLQLFRKELNKESVSGGDGVIPDDEAS